MGRLDDDGISSRRDRRRAPRPEGLDLPEPRFDFEPEKSRLGVFSTSELLAEPVRGNERNRSLTTFNGPTLPYKPQVEIQNARGVRQGGNDLALHRDPVRVDFLVKGFAENDGVF